MVMTGKTRTARVIRPHEHIKRGCLALLPLAWTYRKDYAAAGMKMVSTTDPDGFRTARRAFVS